MEDNVPMDVKEQRLQELMKHTNHWAKVNNEAYKGQVVKVLVDGPSKNNPNMTTGYTPHNMLVNFDAPNAKVGDFVKVKIVKAYSWHLLGELVE